MNSYGKGTLPLAPKKAFIGESVKSPYRMCKIYNPHINPIKPSGSTAEKAGKIQKTDNPSLSDRK